MVRLLLLGLGGLIAVLTVSQQQPVFRTGVRTVAVYATVQKDGRLATDLRKEDFEIRDNGKPVEITLFSAEIQPLTVVLLLDMSGSMATKMLMVREAAMSFIDALLAADRVRIGTFGGREVAISPLLTGDKAVLKRVVREELWPGGHTPLWNAMDLAMTSLAGERGRRVVLVLSDGVDSYPIEPAVSAAQVLQRGIREDYMVYAIRFPGWMEASFARLKNRDAAEPRELMTIAEETGGGNFGLKVDSDLPATLAQVAEELRRQYMLGFTPAVDSKLHSLNVRVTRGGYNVRGRKNYLAAAESR